MPAASGDFHNSRRARGAGTHGARVPSPGGLFGSSMVGIGRKDCRTVSPTCPDGKRRGEPQSHISVKYLNYRLYDDRSPDVRARLSRAPAFVLGFFFVWRLTTRTRRIVFAEIKRDLCQETLGSLAGARRVFDKPKFTWAPIPVLDDRPVVRSWAWPVRPIASAESEIAERRRAAPPYPSSSAQPAPSF